MRKSSAKSAYARLLASARALFAVNGFHATPTRAIADHADVNIALIAYHFKGKEGLYAAVLGDWMEGLCAAVNRETSAAVGPNNRAVAAITEFLRFIMVEADGFSALVVRESIVSTPSPTAARTAVALGPVRDLLESALTASNATITNGARCLALLLRLAAPMASIEPVIGSTERFERARQQALSILLPAVITRDSTPRPETERKTYRLPESPVLDFVD